jgi:imidazolonepropionase-like amidohydrolase
MLNEHPTATPNAFFASVDGSDRSTSASLLPGAPASGQSLHDKIEQLVTGGFTPFEALRAATADAAAALGVDDVLGTIETGKLADLTFVAGDPLQDIKATRRVRRMMRGGRLYEVRP